jgi:hypothetical protein
LRCIEFAVALIDEVLGGGLDLERVRKDVTDARAR